MDERDGVSCALSCTPLCTPFLVDGSADGSSLNPSPNPSLNRIRTRSTNDTGNRGQSFRNDVRVVLSSASLALSWSASGTDSGDNEDRRGVVEVGESVGESVGVLGEWPISFVCVVRLVMYSW